MSKKIIVLVILIVTIVLVYSVVRLLSVNHQSRLSDEQIREKFRCDRVTTEVLETDKYCIDPNAYRIDVKQSQLLPE